MWIELNDVFNMQEIYDRELSLVMSVQTNLLRWKELFLIVSRLGHPSNYPLIYFPIVYHMKQTLGLKLMWTAIFTQFSGLVIKWFVGGERPYWWIHIAHPMENISIEQFNMECDSTPGGVSGHMLVTSAIIALLILNISGNLEKALSSRHFTVFLACVSCHTRSPRVALWTAGAIYLLILGISQLFIAADFPHQVATGLFIGLFLGIVCHRFLDIFKLFGLLSCSVLSASVILVALTSYGGIFHLVSLKELPFRGRNTNNSAAKSVRQAKRWCVRPSFLNDEHIPFCQMISIAGIIFGYGFAIYVLHRLSQRETNLVSKQNGSIGTKQLLILQNGDGVKLTLGKISKILFSLMTMKFINLIPLPRQLDVYNYYAQLIIVVFSKNFFVPVTIMLVIPHFATISSSNWTSVISVNNYSNTLTRSCKRCCALFFMSSILEWFVRISRKKN